LVSLSNVRCFDGTVAAIKTLDERTATWSYVTMRLIEEQRDVYVKPEKKNGTSEGAVLAVRPWERKKRSELRCYKCNEKGHFARDHLPDGSIRGSTVVHPNMS